MLDMFKRPSDPKDRAPLWYSSCVCLSGNGYARTQRITEVCQMGYLTESLLSVGGLAATVHHKSAPVGNVMGMMGVQQDCYLHQCSIRSSKWTCW